MRSLLSIVLVFAIFITGAAAGPDTATIASQIAAMPPGASIELRLHSKETLRGTKGAVTDSGFTLIGSPDRQIAFADVSSIKLLNKKSHTTRNVLIIVAVGIVATVGILAAVVLNGPR
jgi:hypothetical protein